MVTYWLHYAENHGAQPEVKLIYPMPPQDEYADLIFSSIGKITLRIEKLAILDSRQIQLKVVGLSIPELLKLLKNLSQNQGELRGLGAKLLSA